MLSEQIKVLLSQIESLQSILVSVATGGSRIESAESEYQALYKKVAIELERFQEKGFALRNPNPYRSLWDWYGYYSDTLRSYQSRRQYITDLYKELVDPIQDALARQEVEVGSDEVFMQNLLNRLQRNAKAVDQSPIEIQYSLPRFREQHPNPAKAAFIMMKYSNTKAHQEIVEAIKETLSTFDIKGVRADDRQFHDDLFPNILTYMHGCGLGIAVFERIEADEFNPNVSLEVGYMLALGKPICFLKDKTMRTLQTDLTGKLYRPFDPYDVHNTISLQLFGWLADRNFT